MSQFSSSETLPLGGVIEKIHDYVKRSVSFKTVGNKRDTVIVTRIKKDRPVIEQSQSQQTLAGSQEGPSPM